MDLNDGLSAPTWSAHLAKDHQGNVHESYALLVDHDLKDEKGRHVGGSATIVLLPKDFASVYTKDGTLLYRLMVYPTRNGETFGSSNSFSFHATLPQAQTQAHLKLEQQAKSYRKKYGAQALPIPPLY